MTSTTRIIIRCLFPSPNSVLSVNDNNIVSLGKTETVGKKMRVGGGEQNVTRHVRLPLIAFESSATSSSSG